MKAILVIDIPKDFENREPYFVEGSLFCYVKTNYGKYRYVCDLDKTKLKPLPQKKEIHLDFNEVVFDDEAFEMMKLGYNKCINEILGEKK